MPEFGSPSLFRLAGDGPSPPPPPAGQMRGGGLPVWASPGVPRRNRVRPQSNLVGAREISSFSGLADMSVEPRCNEMTSIVFVNGVG